VTFSVFASRIGCTAPKYAVTLGRFDWQRYAVQAIPRVGERDEKIKIPIPWPKPPPPHIPASKLFPVYRRGYAIETDSREI